MDYLSRKSFEERIANRLQQIVKDGAFNDLIEDMTIGKADCDIPNDESWLMVFKGKVKEKAIKGKFEVLLFGEGPSK